MDLLTKFFIFSLFLFPLGEIARYQLGNGIAFTLNDLLISVFGIFYFFSKKNKKENLLILPFLISTTISLLLNIPHLNSFQLFTSFLYPLRWFLYIQILFFISRLTKETKSIVLSFVTISAFASVILGFMQYFWYSDLHKLIYLGWDEHMYRMVSTVLDPNFAGALLVLYFIFALGMYFKEKEHKNYLYLVLTLSSLIAVFLTFSRSAMIMLVISSFVLLLLLRKMKLMMVLLLAVFSFYLFAFRHFNVESINPFRTFSTEERIKSMQEVLSIASKNPLFGVGFNAYRFAQVRYGYRHGAAAMVSHADASTDNGFLFVLATTGIVGFIAFCYFWKKLFGGMVGSFRAHDRKDKIFAAVALASIIGIFVNSFFINSLFFPFVMEWLWVVIGLSLPRESR